MTASIAGRLARASVWSLAESLGVKLAAVTQSFLLARILGLDGFGEWGLVLSTLALVSAVANAGLGLSATKHTAQLATTDPGELGRILALLLAVSIGAGSIAAIMLVAAANPLAHLLYATPALVSPLIVLGCVLWINAPLDIMRSVLVGLECFPELALLSGLGALVSLLATVLLSVWLGVTGAVAGMLVGQLVTVALLASRASRRLRERRVRVRLGPAPRPWAAVWQLSLPVALATLIVSIATWLCLVLLAQRPGGVAEVGGFHAANQLRALIAFLPAQLMAALLPVLFTVMRDGHDRAAQLQRRVTLASAAAAALVALPLALAASPVLDLYGAGFAVFAPVLVLLSAKGVLESASLPLQRILVACDRAWMLVAANGAFGLLLLGLGLALIGPHGAAGLAASLMIAQSVHLLIQWKLSRSALVSRAAG